MPELILIKEIVVTSSAAQGGRRWIEGLQGCEFIAFSRANEIAERPGGLGVALYLSNRRENECCRNHGLALSTLQRQLKKRRLAKGEAKGQSVGRGGVGQKE